MITGTECKATNPGISLPYIELWAKQNIIAIRELVDGYDNSSCKIGMQSMVVTSAAVSSDGSANYSVGG